MGKWSALELDEARRGAGSAPVQVTHLDRCQNDNFGGMATFARRRVAEVQKARFKF